MIKFYQMKKRLSILMLGAVIAFSSCSKYDDSELRGRIESLETWQATVNSQISSLQSIVSALETKDHVTSVTPHSDGTGYVINFEKSDAVTIKHGEKGDAGVSPIIGAKQDTDGKYYWTINGEWLLDNDAKIPTTGDKGNNGNNGNDGADGKDVIAPQVRINQTTGEWEVSTNGGTTWTTTGVKAQGDAIFAKNGVDNTNTDYVEFTLADGVTKIKLPKTPETSIAFDSYETFMVTSTNNEMELLLPIGFKQSDFAAIKAQISNNGGDNNAVITRAEVDKWTVSITQPIFESGEFVKGSLKVRVNPAPTTTNGEKEIGRAHV